MIRSLKKLRHCIFVILLLLPSVAMTQSPQIILDVAEAEAVHNPIGGKMTILVTLTPQSRTAFADFTAKYVGRNLEIRLADQVLTSVIRLQTQMDGSAMYITPQERNNDEVAEIARRLSSQKEQIEFIVLAK